MTSMVDECHLFGLFRKALRFDLVESFGFPNSTAGSILNFFDPADSRYLEHVDAWQRLLCSGAVPDMEVPFARRNGCGSWDIFEWPIMQIDAMHQVAKLLYKYKGKPRRETDFEQVKDRLSQPLPIRLGPSEEESIRDRLSPIALTSFEGLVGRFGPGVTAEGLSVAERWTRREGITPSVNPDIFRVNDRDRNYHFSYGEPVTKITEVPKSLKANRIVSSEPCWYMFCQQAVARCLDEQLHTCFRGHVSLHDQSRHNESLRLHGACSIDLSDASDHVSCELVRRLMPQLWPVLATVRSRYARFPDGTIIPLETFAPMGSGLCFPILTLCCLGICAHAVTSTYEELPNRERRDTAPWYSVYGDDIIVPLYAYDYAIDLLSRSGLVVNRAKSCCTGLYRESCGVELYLSRDITPAMIRTDPATADAAAVESISSRLSEKGFHATARAVADYAKAATRLRYNRDLQKAEVCVRATIAREKSAVIDGWNGLFRWFCTNTSQDVIRKGDNLLAQPSSAPKAVWTKVGWRYKPAINYPYLSLWLVTPSLRKT